MTKILIWLLIAINFISINKNPEIDDKVLWGDKIIEWSDFVGSPPLGYNTTTGAVTTARIEMVKPRQQRFTIPKIEVFCYFIKSKSWTVVKDDYSLAHERLHFDISELYARKIRKAFDSLNKAEVVDVSKYKDCWNSYIIQVGEYHDLYDNEVYGDKIRQMEWEKNIKSELIKLDEFQRPQP